MKEDFGARATARIPHPVKAEQDFLKSITTKRLLKKEKTPSVLEKLLRLFQIASLVVLFVPVKFFMKLRIAGKENLNGLKPPLIIVTNHESYFDSWILGMAITRHFNSPFLPLRFFTADKYFKVWWTGWGLFLKLSGCFPAKRGEGLEVSLRKPMEILMNGGAVVFYPEGKAVREPGKLAEPRRGIGALSIWSGAKILPAAIKRAHNSQKVNKVSFGEPFLIGDIISENELQHAEENYAFVAKAIMDRIQKIYFD